MTAHISNPLSITETELRDDLAAAFRIAVTMGWSESVGNHFSAALPGQSDRFLMNRKWMHFGDVTAENLQLLDCRDAEALEKVDAPDATAWTIHSTLHRLVPHARAILHCHSPYATAIACLADPTIVPIDQNTARFYNKVAIDTGFGGMADEAAEGERLAHALGDKRIMMMGNHGVLVAAETVALAFEDLYYLERACQTLTLARSNNQTLSILSDELAQKTADSWDAFQGMAYSHFDYHKRQIDWS